jgi:hypothetical protein
MTFGKNFLINFSVITKELDTSSIGALADFNEIRALSAKRQNKVSQSAVWLKGDKLSNVETTSRSW